ncbi:MAG: peptidoglycan DD-metalloendopeptidase family protein [Eubacteriales bacterium]
MTKKPFAKNKFNDTIQIKVFTTTKKPINFNIHKRLLMFSLIFVIAFISVSGYLFYYNLNLLNKVQEKEAEISSLEYEANIWKSSTLNLQETIEEKNNIINNKTLNIEEKLYEIEDFKNYLNDFIGTENEGLENSVVSRSFSRNLPNLEVHNDNTKINELLNEFDETLDNDKKDLDQLYEEAENKIAYLKCFPDYFPTSGKITSPFGYRTNPVTYSWEFHHGIDIANELGTEIHSAGDGEVILVDYNYLLGKYILLDHGYGIITKYAHLYTTNVEEGDLVKKGDFIGSMGYTGQSTGSHLHYEIIIENETIDPLKIKKYCE